MEDGIKYRVAIVVVAYNSARDIHRCVTSALGYIGENDCVVVIDNASTDDSCQIVEEISKVNDRLLLLRNPENIGFGRANNVAFSRISARWYCLLNADAWFVCDCLSRALELLESEPDVAIAGLPLVFPDGTPQTSSFAFSSYKKWLLQLLGARTLADYLLKFSWVRALLGRFEMSRTYVASQSRPPVCLEKPVFNRDPRLKEVDWVCGAAMLLRASFIAEFGGFDENIFLYGEDEDICIRASRNNKRVVVCEVFPVVHKFGWRGSDRAVQDMKYYSLMYLVEKNITGRFNRLFMLRLLPLHVYGYSFIGLRKALFPWSDQR